MKSSLKQIILGSAVALFAFAGVAYASILGVQSGGTGEAKLASGYCLTGNGIGPIGTTTCGMGTSTNPLMVNYLVSTSTIATSTFAGGLKIGTFLSVASSTPWGILSVGVPVYSLVSPMFAISSSTSSGSTTPFMIDNNGNLNAGAGAFTVNPNTGSSTASNLYTGPINFPSDGQYSAINLPVSAPVNTVESMSFNIANYPILTVWGQSTGNNGVGTTTVGIGTSTPYSMLSVAGQVVAQNYVATSTTATSTFAGGMSVGGTSGLTIFPNGLAGIGTTMPQNRFDVWGTGAALTVTDTSALGAGVGGGIIFSGNWKAGSTPANFAQIRGIKDTAVGGSSNGDLTFSTFGPLPTNALNERMRITPSGTVGIGTTSPFAPLSVMGNSFIAGNETASYFNATSTSATSTFAGGITSPCFSNNGTTCINGFGTVNSGAVNQVAFYKSNGTGVSGTSTISMFPQGGTYIYPGADVGLKGSFSFTIPSANTVELSMVTPTIVNNGADLTVDSSNNFIMENTESTSLIFKNFHGEAMRITNSGNVGIGTTSPFANLSISTLLSTSTIPFAIATTTYTTASTTLFMIDPAGDVHFGGGTPTLSCSGATGASLDGDSTDQTGTINPGTGASGCTLTFSTPKKISPHCQVTQQTMSLVNALSYTETASALTITQTALSGKIDYFCPLGH